MNISELTVDQLKQATILIDKRERLRAELRQIDERIADIFNMELSEDQETLIRPQLSKSQLRGNQERLATKRGQLKEKILAALKEAGEEGLTIKELSDKIETEGSNFYAWFGSTGKKIRGLEKVGPAKYRWMP